ncbi:MAG: hypothetical protein BWY90_01021 [Deltaproteobacteria bacterium ADurb.BinA014]|nr:MAG: hypothetical protein BWY90_01021 [Deltaproteobacteria bacterium ADurb.BinA014]
MNNNYLRGLWLLLVALAVLLFTPFWLQSACALSVLDTSDTVPAAAIKLVKFCQEPKSELDEHAVATLVEYVLKNKPMKEAALPKTWEATGAYYEFDTAVNFTNFLKYSYNKQIPSALTSPTSLRYSIWNGSSAQTQKIPADWSTILPATKPVVIRGMQHDAITPDLTTGVYYEYDLQRTFILLSHKGKQVLITISKQVDKSNIGKKGVIIGKDDEWNYYYSNEPGSAKTGLGWVKSYIYDFFSVGVYVEVGTSQPMVRSGMFQWIRAGWSGINFAQTEHIIIGMKRYARNFRLIMESSKLPSVEQIASVYQRLAALPSYDLKQKYAVLQQAQKSLAVQSGKIREGQTKKTDAYDKIPKEQIIEELMLEYFKIAIGKNSLIEKKQFLALIDS